MLRSVREGLTTVWPPSRVGTGSVSHLCRPTINSTRLVSESSPKGNDSKLKRVRTRVAAVAVVVRELHFFVTSVICMRIRGRGSEVTTTPYHIQEG